MRSRWPVPVVALGLVCAATAAGVVWFFLMVGLWLSGWWLR